MINLNNDEFNASEGVAIFNDGNAGVVENVKISVEKKKPEDKENSPDYRLVFTDSKGATCNYPFWYVAEKTEWNSVEELIQKQGKVLKHIVHAIAGKDFQFPQYKSPREMLDGIMKTIRESLKSNLTFRIFANYGAGKHAKKYIQPRTWVPFMESSTVPLEETRLSPGNLDVMERLEADSFSETGSFDSGTDSDDDEGW